mmetsp:Transcript_10005/g.33071  ORF Transcript_10005/g.33071 Transcript_10005/m.33071 type:complete len:232 (-) Transcript_10005:94-789(-)
MESAAAARAARTSPCATDGPAHPPPPKQNSSSSSKSRMPRPASRLGLGPHREAPSAVSAGAHHRPSILIPVGRAADTGGGGSVVWRANTGGGGRRGWAPPAMDASRDECIRNVCVGASAPSPRATPGGTAIPRGERAPEGRPVVRAAIPPGGPATVWAARCRIFVALPPHAGGGGRTDFGAGAAGCAYTTRAPLAGRPSLRKSAPVRCPCRFVPKADRRARPLAAAAAHAL